MRRLLQRPPRGEQGAALVVLAVTVVVLFAFAALAVDLGFAWAERREAQSVVDAAVMAGALEYLSDEPKASEDIVDTVRDYASRNTDLSADSPDWVTCRDPEGSTLGFSAMTDSDGNSIECISLKQGATGDAESLLRVRLPDRVLSTFFARVIGFDTIDVSAVAVAEIKPTEQSTILPLSLPSDFQSEECLATPPLGHLRLEESSICPGPIKGNFGLLDSPFFENHVSTRSLEGCRAQPNGGSISVENFNTRAPFNLAAGIDHALQPWPGDDWEYKDYGNNHAGADSCSADTEPPQIPYVLSTGPGDRDLLQGLVGRGPYDGLPGRLRQSGGIGDRILFETTNDSYTLDNVGLWQYLDTPTGNPAAECRASYYTPAREGRPSTAAIERCLSAQRDDDANHPEFLPTIITSPRFALVPVLAYLRVADPLLGDSPFTGREHRAVIEFIPVYIQSTWYSCNSASAPCWFQPPGLQNDPDIDGDYSILFNPGEGTEGPLSAKTTGGVTTYSTPKSINLDGISGFVLDWEWLYPGAKNDLGNVAPLSVSLFE